MLICHPATFLRHGGLVFAGGIASHWIHLCGTVVMVRPWSLTCHTDVTIMDVSSSGMTILIVRKTRYNLFMGVWAPVTTNIAKVQI